MAASEPNVMKWSEPCKSLHALGHMKDFSKGECFRVSDQLKQLIADGKVERIARGRYRFVPNPELVPEEDEP